MYKNATFLSILGPYLRKQKGFRIVKNIFLGGVIQEFLILIMAPLNEQARNGTGCKRFFAMDEALPCENDSRRGAYRPQVLVQDNSVMLCNTKVESL